MALKPPFSSLYYCPEVLSPLVVSPPPRSFLPMSIGGLHRRCLNLVTPYPGGALTWRCLILATPTPGDASSWRRLHLDDASSWRRPTLVTPQVVNSLTFFLGSPEGPHHTLTFDFDFDFGQRPGTGRYTSPPSLELTLVSAKRLRPRPSIYVAFLLT